MRPTASEDSNSPRSLNRKKMRPQMASDGGNDPELYEKGQLTFRSHRRGLVGYWPLNEGTGSTAI